MLECGTEFLMNCFQVFATLNNLLSQQTYQSQNLVPFVCWDMG